MSANASCRIVFELEGLVQSRLFRQRIRMRLTMENKNSLHDPALLSRNFPDLSAQTIDRQHLLETIAQMASSDVPIVFLEGEAGIGATTLQAQFCAAHAEHVFTLFIKPASRFAYSVDYLRLVIAEQFWWYLHGTRLEQDVIDISQFASLQLSVRRKARNATLYFVVDGLHQIPVEDQRFVDQIFREVLPVGIDAFRFVVTGSQDLFQRNLGATRSKTFHLLKFSDTESDAMLSGLEIPESQRGHIKRMCKGVPGNLASVRRLIISGVSAETILDSDPEKYLEFISLEFEPIKQLTDTQRTLLSILAFSRHALSVNELLAVCPEATGVDIDEIRKSCMFLNFTSADGLVEFASEAHRRFAERQLQTNRQDALTRQVEHLIKDPSSPVAIRLLPTYYQLLNQQQAIVDLLSKEHYAELLEVTQSISALRARAALGARSAMELQQATDIFKFALQRSIFSAVGGMDELQSEVSALVALGQNQRALEIAALPATKEARLTMMAEYCRRIREKGRPVEAELSTYIKELAADIDFGEMGEAAIPLAENLLFVDPDLALSIVDKSIKAEAGQKSRDAALAQLSMAATMSNVLDKEDVNEKTRSRISDESIQKLLGSLNSIVSNFSYEEIVRIASEMQIGRRIYFLRSLVAASHIRPRVLDVVEYALDQLVADTTYSPKARDLADLALPLAYAQPPDSRIQKLAKRLESQLGLVEKGAPSKDLVLLQMRLAHAELGFDVEHAKARIAEAYYDVAAMGNVETQAACLSSMLSALSLIDKDGTLESGEGFREVIKDDLLKDMAILLGSTANHYQTIAYALRSLSKASPSDALVLVEKINTLERRDRAYREIAKTLAGTPFTKAKAQFVELAISKIEDRDSIEESVLAVIESASNEEDVVAWLPYLEEVVLRLSSPKSICAAALALVSIRVKCGELAGIEGDIAKFDSSVLLIDSLFSRIELNFELASAVATSHRQIAERAYSSAKDLRATASLSSRSAGTILVACLNLLLRAFRPLIRVDELPSSHLDRFVKLCDLLPCSLTRATVYGDLAVKAWCEGKHDICRAVLANQIRPMLEAAQLTNKALHASLCEILFPALYCGHRATAYRALEEISLSSRAVAVHSAAMVVLRKLAPSEPSNEVEDDRVRLSHEELVDVVELLDKAPDDWVFYSILESTAKAVTHKDNRLRITGQQRVDFASKAWALAQVKLPDNKNIKHNGYLIVSRAQILRLTETKKAEEWNDLIKEADSINNVADLSYVLLEIAQCLPSRLSAESKRLIQRSHALIMTIPSANDRYTRLEAYIKIARRISPIEAKSALKDALMLTFETSQRDMASRWRRNLVDLAELMQPGLVDELSEMIDDDPARAEAKAEIKRSVDVQKLKKKISGSGEIDPSTLTSKALPSAAWRNVSALVGGRLESKAPTFLSPYVNAAGGFDLRHAYPVLSWYLENSARRFVSVHDVNQLILPLSEVLLLATEIATSVMSQVAVKSRPMPGALDLDSSVSLGAVIKPGERPQALLFLRQWLRANASEHVFLCDPYFKQTDIEFMRLVLAECPLARVTVITSKKAVTENGREFDSQSFLAEWIETIDQDPPQAEILAVGGYVANEVLVHDRWLLSGGAGLRLGTSFGSLGAGKLTEISTLTASEVASVEVELGRFINRARIVNGSRVSYVSVSL